MHDSQNLKGNGAAAPSELPQGEARRIADQGRQIYNDATALAAEVRGAGADLEHYVVDQVTRRPFASVGLAAGLGYVLGGGLRSRITTVLLATATRVGMVIVTRELAARLAPQTPAPLPKQELSRQPETNSGAKKE